MLITQCSLLFIDGSDSKPTQASPKSHQSKHKKQHPRTTLKWQPTNSDSGISSSQQFAAGNHFWVVDTLLTFKIYEFSKRMRRKSLKKRLIFLFMNEIFRVFLLLPNYHFLKTKCITLNFFSPAPLRPLFGHDKPSRCLAKRSKDTRGNHTKSARRLLS